MHDSNDESSHAVPQSNQPLPDYHESLIAVNINENHDQVIESNSASANAGDGSSNLPATSNLINHKGISVLQF